MALTVLAIGMLGVMALQTSTIGANSDANQLAVAQQVARTWIQRLQRDAQRWNHPSRYNASSDLATDTVWLARVRNATAPNAWAMPMPAAGIEPNVSPAFDPMGQDIAVGSANYINAVYCTHYRLRELYLNELIQAEVRVFWKKRRVADYGTYSTYGLTNGLCTTTADPAVLGKDDKNFRWTYAVSGIAKARAL